MTTNQMNDQMNDQMKSWIMFKPTTDLTAHVKNDSINTSYYGVLNIQTSVAQDQDQDELPLLLNLMVDESGSMESKTSTRKYSPTKMKLLQHTLINMFNYLADKKKNVYVQLSGFDNKIRKYISPTKITHENVKSLINIINEMYSRLSTDLGLALQTLDDELHDPEIGIPLNQRVGILLTDGAGTIGKTDPVELSKIVRPGNPIHFIALGEDHSAETMNLLGKSTPTATNWFIGNFEQTGNVYGEILFNELNRVLDDVCLTVENGKIYNYNTGEFVEMLNIGNLSSETKKNYHIICDNPDDCIVKITGNKGGETINNIMEATDLPPLIDVDDGPMPEYEEIHFVEIQYLRLCVQQLMTDVRINVEIDTPVQNLHINSNRQRPTNTSNIGRLKHNQKYYNKNSMLQTDIKEFMTKYGMETNPILLGIMDDLRVIYNTMGNEKYLKYGIAREISQGTQTACVADASPLDDSYNPFQLDSNIIESPYMTPGRSSVMRAISQQVDDSYDEDAMTCSERYMGNTGTNSTQDIYPPPIKLERSQHEFNTV